MKLLNSEKADDSREFTFDHSYFTDTTQEQVYTDLGKKVVTQALDGYNGTIFAYGQVMISPLTSQPNFGVSCHFQRFLYYQHSRQCLRFTSAIDRFREDTHNDGFT